MELQVKNLELEKVNFEKNEFVRTKLQGIDFSRCNISNIMFDLYSIKGIIVDKFQCFNLVGILGVEIKY